MEVQQEDFPRFLHSAQDFRRRQKYPSISSTAFSPKSPVLTQAGFIHLKLFVSWEKLVCVNIKFFLTAAGHTGFTLVGRDGATTSEEQVCGGSRTGDKMPNSSSIPSTSVLSSWAEQPQIQHQPLMCHVFYEAFTSLER